MDLAGTGWSDKSVHHAFSKYTGLVDGSSSTRRLAAKGGPGVWSLTVQYIQYSHLLGKNHLQDVVKYYSN